MKIRIVGLNENTVFIQTIKNGNWIQEVITKDELKDLMRLQFPKYWIKYLKSQELDQALFFYNYGYENGRTYIFDNGKA